MNITDVEKLILENSSVQWKKVAMIVGDVLFLLIKKYPDGFDISIHDVLLRLVDEGKLELVGDREEMRASEVRLLP